MTQEQKATALKILMFLKEKRNRAIKGYGILDRRKQQETIEPKDATSQTVSTEAILLTTVIDALEGREVAVVDILGAYLSANINNEVYIRFQGKVTEIMVVA